MEIYWYSLGSVVVVSLISLVGVFTLSLKAEILRKYVFVLVSLAVGALLGDALIHLLPEAFETARSPVGVSVLVIVGIFIFFVLEKILHWHHHSHECREGHPVGKLIIISDGVHNFVDGLIIGASYLISIEVGLATTLAVILHEIPQEIGDFGVLLHAGYSKARALWLNFFSGLFAIAGVFCFFLWQEISGGLAASLIPFAAGGFIYVALSDLVPELQKESKPSETIAQIVAIALGLSLMFLLFLTEN